MQRCKEELFPQYQIKKAIEHVAKAKLQQLVKILKYIDAIHGYDLKLEILVSVHSKVYKDITTAATNKIVKLAVPY